MQDPVSITEALKALSSLYATEIKAATQPDWDQVVRDCRRADLFYRGIQYLATMRLNDGRLGLVDATSAYSNLRSQLVGDAPEGMPEMLDYSLNWYKGDINKFVAVASKQTLQHKAAPIAPSYKDQAEEKLRIADQVSDYLDALWQIPDQRERVLYSMALYGPTFLYTPFMTDSKFGKTSSIVYSHQVVETPAKWACVECGEESIKGEEAEGPEGELRCPHCQGLLVEDALIPATQDIEIKEEAVETTNGTTQLHVTNFLTTWVPKGCTGPEDAPWWVYEYNAPRAHINRLLDQVGGKLITSTAPDTLASWVRNRVMTPGGVSPQPLRDNGKISRVWWSPSMYYALPEGCGCTRQWLLENFPRGCMMLMINEEGIALEAEAVTDSWVSISPEIKDYLLNQQAVFHPYFEVVEMVNAILNLVEGIIATSAPVTAYRSDLIDPEVANRAMTGNRSMIPIKGDARGAFADLPVSQPSGVAQAFIEFLIAKAREIVGISGAMWGAMDFSTARAATLAVEQALQVFAPIFNKVAAGFAEAKKNSALLLAEYSGGVLPMKDGRTKPMLVEGIETLLEGGWKYSFDPTLATSSAARRDTIKELLNNPAASQMTGLNHPFNIRAAQEILGLNGMYVPGEDEVKFIRELTEKVMNGEAVPLPPTNLVNPQMAVDVIKAQLVSDRGRQLWASDPEKWNAAVEWMEGMMGMMGTPPGPPPDQGAPPPPQGNLPPGGPPPQMEGPPLPQIEGEVDAPPMM